MIVLYREYSIKPKYESSINRMEYNNIIDSEKWNKNKMISHKVVNNIWYRRLLIYKS